MMLMMLLMMLMLLMRLTLFFVSIYRLRLRLNLAMTLFEFSQSSLQSFIYILIRTVSAPLKKNYLLNLFPPFFPRRNWEVSMSSSYVSWHSFSDHQQSPLHQLSPCDSPPSVSKGHSWQLRAIWPPHCTVFSWHLFSDHQQSPLHQLSPFHSPPSVSKGHSWQLRAIWTPHCTVFSQPSLSSTLSSLGATMSLGLISVP